MQSPFFQKKIIWNIRIWQAAAFLLFYLFFAFQYWLALWYTSAGRDNIWKEALIDYFLLKLSFTIPLWWLYFVFWKEKPLLFKLAMHLVTGPLWVFCWFHSYRLIQDWRGAGYLQGNAIGWDIYIPGLVYFLQFAVFHVYDFYTQTQKQKQKEKELMQAAYNSEVNALKAQIQPHFLFNTLNSISATVPPAMEHTRELIAQLADTFRYSLQASEKEWIPLSQELDFIKTVLALEQQRLKDRLQTEFVIDESLLKLNIPPMLLQPIVENAIKHGISPSLEGGKVTVSVTREDKKVRIDISDTGAGYFGEISDNLFAKGIGLRNTNLRLRKLYQETIHVKRNQPSGMHFYFYLPI
jgi:two-component system LytT family sensor kinase